MLDLGALLDRLNGLLGRAYLLAGLIPVVVATLCSAGLVYADIPSWRAPLSVGLSLTGWKLTLISAGLAIALSVLGFGYWAAVPVFRRVLAGRLDWIPVLGPEFARWLLSRQRARCTRLDEALKVAQMEVTRFRQADPLPGEPRFRAPHTWIDCLRSAATTGDGRTVPQPPGPGRDGIIREVHAAVERAQHHQAMDFNTLDALVQKLATERRCGPASPPNDSLADAIFLFATKVLPYARENAERNLYAALSERYSSLPYDDGRLAPTLLGNLLQVESEYGVTRYALDSNLFGPHLLRAASADSAFTEQLIAARLNADVGVAFCTVFALITVAWLLLSGFFGTYWYVGALVAVVGTLATAAFYQVSVIAQAGATAMTRALVDLYRFQVLEALHLPLPTDDTDERAAWTAAAGRAQLTAPGTVTYHHPATAGA